MNEIEALSAHGGVDAPDPVVIHRAREQLMTTILDSERNDSPATNTPALRRSPAPRRRARVAAVATAAAAVLATGALVVTTLVAGDAPPAAAELERLAAVAQRHEVAGVGTVVHTTSTTRRHATTQAGDGSSATTAEEVEREMWIAPDGSGRIIETSSAGRSDEGFGPGELTPTSFAGWPTTADEVGERLRQEAERSGMRPIETEMFVLAGDLLRETAAPPQVRAAIFEAVADLDGVRPLGTVTDRLGRTGIGFEIDSDSDHNARFKLIFDPTTSELLAEDEGTISEGYADGEWAVYTLSELVPAVPTSAPSGR